MATNNKIVGYLPNDAPPVGQIILLGFQHVLTMFPATVLVAALCGFHVGTVLTVSGLGTMVALLLSKWRIGKFIPLFYGSSFSYIAAYLAIAQQMTGSLPEFGVPLPNDVISTIQSGIIVTGLLNIAVGFLIRAVGKDTIDMILPPIVTGSVAAIIGFGLAAAALGMASANWGVSILTLVVTILFSVYLQGRGFIGMLPVLLGAITGYIASAVLSPGSVNFAPVAAASWFAVPTFTLPSFSGAMVGTAIFSVSIMAIATIPESTAHLYQISLYVDRLATDMDREKYELDKYIGFNLILDGVDDTLKGLLGATAGTNYGENNSLMAISRNYSGPALVGAGVIAILLGFVGKLAGLVQTVPLAVSGGLAIYLFGAIGMQGIALMQEHKVSMFDPRNLAVGATIMVVGIGGNIGYEGGFLPIPFLQGLFPSGLPAIATAAVLGILVNAIFLVFKPPMAETEVLGEATAAADD
ncbi:MAG: xanthine permease [Anaerolineales bacterium]|nr:xanthine permease [Anaerolineae bacterium]PWB70804.1 MAG: xanthine permease [Anaerolineales bacterium]